MCSLVWSISVLRDENHEAERERLARTDRYNDVEHFFDVDVSRTFLSSWWQWIEIRSAI